MSRKTRTFDKTLKQINMRTKVGSITEKYVVRVRGFHFDLNTIVVRVKHVK